MPVSLTAGPRPDCSPPHTPGSGHRVLFCSWCWSTCLCALPGFPPPAPGRLPYSTQPSGDWNPALSTLAGWMPGLQVPCSIHLHLPLTLLGCLSSYLPGLLPCLLLGLASLEAWLIHGHHWKENLDNLFFFKLIYLVGCAGS